MGVPTTHLSSSVVSIPDFDDHWKVVRCSLEREDINGTIRMVKCHVRTGQLYSQGQVPAMDNMDMSIDAPWRYE